MSEQVVSIGRIVRYVLDQNDADEINRRRTNDASIRARLQDDRWPDGAQAHIGNHAEAGQEYPLVITRVWSPTTINGQVLLDGNDVLWVTSVLPGETPHSWHWPERG